MLNSFSNQEASKVACVSPDLEQKTEGNPDNWIHPKETAQVHIQSLPESPAYGILYSPAAKVCPEEPSVLPLTGGQLESIWENGSPQPKHNSLLHRT